MLFDIIWYPYAQYLSHRLAIFGRFFTLSIVSAFLPTFSAMETNEPFWAYPLSLATKTIKIGLKLSTQPNREATKRKKNSIFLFFLRQRIFTLFQSFSFITIVSQCLRNFRAFKMVHLAKCKEMTATKKKWRSKFPHWYRRPRCANRSRWHRHTYSMSIYFLRCSFFSTHSNKQRWQRTQLWKLILHHKMMKTLFLSWILNVDEMP